MPFFVSLIAPGFKSNPEKFALATNLTKITFPFILFVSLASFFSAILNSHNRFAAASAAPIILNIVMIGILICGKVLGEKLVIYLSYGVSIAGFIQVIFLIIFVKKFFKPKLKFNFRLTHGRTRPTPAATRAPSAPIRPPPRALRARLPLCCRSFDRPPLERGRRLWSPMRAICILKISARVGVGVGRSTASSLAVGVDLITNLSQGLGKMLHFSYEPCGAL